MKISAAEKLLLKKAENETTTKKVHEKPTLFRKHQHGNINIR